MLTESVFLLMVSLNVPFVLECLFQTNPELLGKSNEDYNSKFHLKPSVLWEAFGEVAFETWTTGILMLKKILPTMTSYYVAQKKLYHAIRILDFGIQLTNSGKQLQSSLMS